MSSPVFKAAPFFFIQTAIRSKEELDFFLSQKDWVETILSQFENDACLREAILIASPSLYESLKKKPSLKPQALAASLFRYFVRMSTRSTPFGLFSFVMNGTWDKKTTINFDVNQLKKRARPDMEWLFSLIRQIYQNKKAFPLLSVQANPLMCLEGDRFILNYLLYPEEIENGAPKTVSIRATPVIKVIFRLAKQSISIECLWQKLSLERPDLVRQKSEELLYSLLEQQLLIPALRPSLLSPFSFKALSSFAPHVDSIAQLIGQYEQTELGKGESQLVHLKDKMQALIPLKHILQVDSYSQSTQRIHKIVSKELEETLDILWKLSPALNPPSPLDGYLEKFMEVYGTYRTVPLLELFSDNRGLGPFKASIPAKKSEFGEKWESWLFCQWQLAIRQEKEEIVLTSQSVDDFLAEVKEPAPHPSKAIPSLDLFCTICASSPEALDQGEFEILYSQSNWQGGGSAGRFLDLLGQETKKNYQDYFEAEKELEPKSIFAELSYWPFKVRNANVAIQPCLRTYRLDLEEKEKVTGSISLEDVYVGVAENRFYLTLKEGEKELIFRSGNFLNPDFAPAPLNFCRDVSLFRSHRISAFSWGKLGSQAIFLPRVRFQRTILSPAQWKLTLTELQDLKPNLSEAFLEWIARWKLPKDFFLLQQDQPLLFSMDHPHTIEEIVRLIKKDKVLRLIESKGTSLIQSSQGKHLFQLIIPFLKTTPSSCHFYPRPYSPVLFDVRWKLHGSEWIYVNFYLNAEGFHDFLVDHLIRLGDHLSKMEGALGWFFVRYNLPSNHIRFRFQFSSTASLASVLILLEEIAAIWMKEGRIQRHELANYQREVERYGGIDSIELAEKFFHADSLSVLFLLKSPLLNQPDMAFYALSTFYFLKTLGLSHKEIMLCLEENHSRSLLEGYREHKKRLNRLLLALETEAEEFLEIRLLKEASALRSKITEHYCSIIKHRPDKLTIYKSLLHMHCNRLGLDPITEQKTRLYTLHGLQQYLLQTPTPP